MKRPGFWILLTIIALTAAVVGARLFPSAFSMLSLDIAMDRDHALAAARAIMARDHLGPAGFQQAASFSLDEQAQTFVELEGGGKDAFTRMLHDGLYEAYAWRVRQFKEGETNETLIRFAPRGTPYGFVEKVKEDAPGAALDPTAARSIAERAARTDWAVDFRLYTLVESGLERRPSGRVDHTFTYERASPTLNEGRYRVRLVVTGDRLTEVTPFVKIPEAFTRRYEAMRSANEAIGTGSVVGMMLLYGVGGIGLGLFAMLRQRRVIWRQAVHWGAVVALLQALATLNDWPLMWMNYDTAVPRSLFIAQQLAALLAVFVGSTGLFGLSFMAAETLTRKAFGSHPQFWRVWARGPGSSTAVLGRTVAGYLLVSVFFAYDVILYLVATRSFGWWSPSEALLHPDVLASYVPWFSAIANSFQAGFWEECLFRAVPLAGAALIGDRFGKRRLFLVIGFIVQVVIFGSGHAPYPTQPSFARPVELILPSIGFGALYLYFGLLPGIVLHFLFDTVWFALPLFVATASGVWIQRTMVVLVAMVPLWIVLWRRMQRGEWTLLDASDRNLAWVPELSATPPVAAPHVAAPHTIGPGARLIWMAMGGLGLAGCAVFAVVSHDTPDPPFTRRQAADVARVALQTQGVTLSSHWKVLPVPEGGDAGPQRFVSETAGETRRASLLGVYLPKPRWRVRVATFEGDVAERAEEWRVFVNDQGQTRITHTLPEARPGAMLDEAAARTLARKALIDRLGLDVDRGQVREVSATPSKLAARTDWRMTFTDTSVPALPQGEPRIDVVIAGDAVTEVGRYIHVPEEWTRAESSVETRNSILQILLVVGPIGILIATTVVGVIGWSRGRFAPRLCFAAAGLLLLLSIASTANGWPTLLASLSTAQPLALQVGGVVSVGVVGLVILSAVVGLALGSLPPRLSSASRLGDVDAWRLGLIAGPVWAAVAAATAALRTPVWAKAADVSALSTAWPFLAHIINPLSAYLTETTVIASALMAIHTLTSGWSRRRVLGGLALAGLGFVSAGAPEGAHLGGWLVAGVLGSGGALVLYIALLRADLTMLPVGLGAAAMVGILSHQVHRAFSTDTIASLVAAVIVMLASWWLFRALRRPSETA